MGKASFELELQEAFLSEVKEMLEDTESAFVEIEDNPHDKGRIDEIFRLVHTVKGSANIAGFSQLGEFAHVFETLLGDLREGKIAINPQVVDILLLGNDTLKSFVRLLSKDAKGTLNIDEPLEKIQYLIKNKMESSRALTQPQESLNQDLDKGKEDKVTLLICDDDREIGEILKDILADEGYRVLATDSSRKALEIFSKDSIQVIFTDLKMPEMNGIEFVSAVRKINEYVPIIFVSGQSSKADFKKYIDLGVNGFIEKPFEADEVIREAYRASKEWALRNALLNLSRLSFQAYVSMEKLLFLSSLDDSGKAEKKELEGHMEKIRKVMRNLLDSERSPRLGQPNE